METATIDPHAQTRARLRDDLPYWTQAVGYIVNKESELVPFEMNLGQLAFDAALEEQRAQGKPMRGIVLKARQIGFSTSTQAKLIQRTTQRENHHAAVVAHDRETGGNLYAMGDRFYRHLPDDKEAGIKPPIMGHRRRKELHFGEVKDGQIIPDSTYLVDTANEFHAGRGSTYHSLHLSEFAFWADPETKLTALLSAVPKSPDSLVVIESTANGSNYFKDLWDNAEAGKNDWVAFFWPWWKHDEYRLPFANAEELIDFRIGEGDYGEDEPKLVELLERGGYAMVAIKEKLAWRRTMILNDFNGKVSIFKQEYPATAEEAFISTGRQVFDPYLVQGVLIDCEKYPKPELVKLDATDRQIREGRLGRVEVPKDPRWTPRSKLPAGEDPPWTVFEFPDLEKQYLIGNDVSGGVAGGTQSSSDEPAFDTIEVIEHESRLQVAEFHDRLDADLLAVQVYLAAVAYNNAWILIETTGGWGLPVARKIWLDFRYPYLFFRKRLVAGTDRQEDRLGWDTNRQTKPILEANFAEMLREGTHGIRSRDLGLELKTHVRDVKGKTGPESGKFNDRLMAYMIAQQGANLLPLKKSRSKNQRRHNPRDPVTGY